MKSPYLGRLVVFSSLAAFAVSPSSAQSSPSAGSTEPETITLNPFEVNAEADDGYSGAQSVSGTRTRTELINLPMSMQVFTDQFIKDLAATDLIDVVGYASGVSKGTGQATNDDDNTNFTLRGQSSFLPMRNGFRRLRFAPAANIDRVEIIKGPASLLYGQLNPGGNVNYITKRPKPTQQFASIALEVGSYEFHRAVLDVNQPIIRNRLAVRFVGSAQDNKAITDRLYNATTLFNPSITWWITPTSSITLEYERAKRNTNAPRSLLPYSPLVDFQERPAAVDRSWNTASGDDYLDTDMEVFTAELVHRFNDNFTVRANYTDSVWVEEKKVNGTNINLTGANLTLLPRRTLAYRDRGSWDKWFQTELVNNFTFKGVEVQNIVGYQFEELEFRALLNGTQTTASPTVQWDVTDPSTWVVTNLTAADAVPAASTGNKSTNTTHSYYFANQMSFFEGRVRTLLGLRYDDFEVAAYNKAADTTTVTEATPAEIPQVGLLFKATENISLYSTYSESFLPVFSTSRRADGTFYSPDPQSGIGGDLGVKVQLKDGRISFTAAVFALENTNIIRSLAPVTVNGETFSPTEQSGVERSTGFEFDARLRPTAGSQVIVSYGYTDAYVKSDVQNTATREGHQLGNAPKHTFAVFWRQNLGDFGPARKTFFTVGGRYVGERPFSETWNLVGGVAQQPWMLRDYTVFDVGVGTTVTTFGRAVELGLNVKNVLDEEYLSSRFHFGDPRTYIFSLRTRF